MKLLSGLILLLVGMLASGCGSTDDVGVRALPPSATTPVEPTAASKPTNVEPTPPPQGDADDERDAGDTGLNDLEFTTSFGMCFGYCDQTFTFAGNRVQLASDSRGEEPPLANTGELTAESAEKLRDALGAARSATLAEVYGCPDCADGGASSVLIDDTSHFYDFGNPPPELQAMDTVLMSAREALVLCTSNRVVTVADDCTPLR